MACESVNSFSSHVRILFRNAHNTNSKQLHTSTGVDTNRRISLFIALQSVCVALRCIIHSFKRSRSFNITTLLPVLRTKQEANSEWEWERWCSQHRTWLVGLCVVVVQAKAPRESFVWSLQAQLNGMMVVVFSKMSQHAQTHFRVYDNLLVSYSGDLYSQEATKRDKI